MLKIYAKTPPVFTHPNKAAIVAWLNVNALDKDVSFDEVRQALSVSANELADGAIHQIALDEGFEVGEK